MLRRWLDRYRYLVVLAILTLPALALGGCGLERWLIPIGVSVATYLGLQLMRSA